MEGVNDKGRISRRIRLPLLIGIAAVLALLSSGRISIPSNGGRSSEASPTPVESMSPGMSAAPTASGVPGTGAERLTETQRSIEKYRAQLAQAPGDRTAQLLLGFAYLQNVREKGDPTDYGRAEAAFDAVLSASPDEVNALVGKGTLALARHEFRDALQLGQRITRLAPRNPDGWGVLADAQTELGMYPEAVKSVQRMVDLRPDLASFSRVSYQRELHGQMRNATSAMEEAVEIGSANPENQEYVRVLLGNLHLATGDLAAAERTYTESLARLPGFTWALAGMARVRGAEGRFDEAIDLYQQAADRIPLPEFLIGLGEMQEAAGRTREANDTYQVVRAVQQLFRTNGVDTDLDLALFEANHGTDPAAALELARAAYERQPNIKAADALAWALHKNGQHDAARKRIDESLRLGTHDGLHLYHAGEIAHAQGDDAAARRYLRRALEVNPTFSPLYAPKARALLEELGG